MTYRLYIVLLLLKTTFSKCLIYKSASGKFFAVKEEKVSQKCLNGVLLKSSSDHSLICLPNASTFSRNESLSCVIDDVMSRNIQSEKDYFDDDDTKCKCGQENQRYRGNHENRIMFPEDVKGSLKKRRQKNCHKNNHVSDIFSSHLKHFLRRCNTE